MYRYRNPTFGAGGQRSQLNHVSNAEYILRKFKPHCIYRPSPARVLQKAPLLSPMGTRKPQNLTRSKSTKTHAHLNLASRTSVPPSERPSLRARTLTRGRMMAGAPNASRVTAQHAAPPLSQASKSLDLNHALYDFYGFNI